MLFTDEQGEKMWGLPELFDARLPRLSSNVIILSPFDNLVTERERLASVFGFD